MPDASAWRIVVGMNAVVLQLDLVWHDRVTNHTKARRMLEQHRPKPGDLVVLPEAFPVGFSMQIDEIADRDGATDAFIGELSREFGVWGIAGNMIKPDDRGRNVALVANPSGEIVGRYAKCHAFTPAGEHAKYATGDDVLIVDIDGVKVSPMICYDLRFPELFRVAVRRGAEVLVVIANWPTARVHHWTSLLVARAIENQAVVIGCNRCGADPHVPYPGRSLVIDPRGQILADAGDAEGVISTPIDVSALRAYREQFPALRDMRFVPDRLSR